MVVYTVQWNIWILCSICYAQGDQPTNQQGWQTVNETSHLSHSYMKNNEKISLVPSLRTFQVIWIISHEFSLEFHQRIVIDVSSRILLFLFIVINLIRSISIFTNEMSFSWKVAVLLCFVISFFLWCARSMTMNKNSLGVAYINSF